jgi:hypothetical protein
MPVGVPLAEEQSFNKGQPGELGAGSGQHREKRQPVAAQTWRAGLNVREDDNGRQPVAWWTPGASPKVAARSYHASLEDCGGQKLRLSFFIAARQLGSKGCPGAKRSSAGCLVAIPA